MSDPIPEIQSAFLNIITAKADCRKAAFEMEDGDLSDVVIWITEAINQLESAKAKIERNMVNDDTIPLWCAWCGKWTDHQSGWCKHAREAECA